MKDHVGFGNRSLSPDGDMGTTRQQGRAGNRDYEPNLCSGRPQGLTNAPGRARILRCIAQENGLIVPSELVLLGKTMMQLDEVGRILDPNFDTNAAIRHDVAALMARRMRKEFTQGNVYSALLEMKDFAAGLPSRLNQIMDTITNSELEVKVKATDAKMVMDGMQKIANRITMGIVLAGLIVGASLLTRVATPFQVFGLPGLAFLCFLAAAIGSFWLVIRILISDYRSRKKYMR